MSSASVSNLVNKQNGMKAAAQTLKDTSLTTKGGVQALGGGLGEPGTQAVLQTLADNCEAAIAALEALQAAQGSVDALAEATAD